MLCPVSKREACGCGMGTFSPPALVYRGVSNVQNVLIVLINALVPESQERGDPLVHYAN